MDFNLGEDRQMLADTVGRYLAERYTFPERMKAAESDYGFSRDAWTSLAELGVIGALFDKASGGFGGSGLDIAIVFEALATADGVATWIHRTAV